MLDGPEAYLTVTTPHVTLTRKVERASLTRTFSHKCTSACLGRIIGLTITLIITGVRVNVRDG